MAAKGTWKKFMSELAQIISLAVMIGKGHQNWNRGSKKREIKNNNKKSDLILKDPKKNKRIKHWMLEKPEAGEPKSKMVNIRKCHWCHKCNNENS